MPDWITDQQPFETPLEAAAPEYEKIAPTSDQSFGAQFEESSPVTWLERAVERGAKAGSSWFDQALSLTGEANAGMAITPPEQSTTLSAEEANQLYAPPGTKITNRPIDQGLAQVISRQKYDEVNREGVLSRYADDTGPLTRFATGTAAFLLDPLNLSTAFIPGVGEEAVLGKLGYASAEAAPFAARVVARGVSGFTGGAAAQAPLAGLHYGLSQEEDGDYGLRQAALDIAFSGGLNAAVHAGITGPLSDLFRRDPERASTPDPVAEAPPQTRYEAMSAAVSQLADGREVETSPVFAEAGIDAAQSPAVARAPVTDLADRLRAYVSGTKGSLDPTQIAGSLGISVEDAQRGLSTLAGSSDSGLVTGTDGNLRRRAVRREPSDVLTFLADHGGIRDDEGHDLASGRGLQQLVPGAGMLIRKTGMSVDRAGELLHEAGYFPVERPTEDEVLQLLERANREKVYRHQDLNEVEEKRASAENDEAMLRAHDELHETLGHAGLEFSPDERAQAVDLMGYGRTAEQAIAEIAHRASLEDLGDLARETEDEYYANRELDAGPQHPNERPDVSADGGAGEGGGGRAGASDNAGESGAPLGQSSALGAGRRIEPAGQPRLSPADIAREQQRLYLNGYAPGIPQPEFDRINDAIYGPKEEEPRAAPATAAAGAKPIGKPATGTAETAPKTEAEAQLGDLEQKWKAVESTVSLTPAERAELDHSAASVEQANKQSAGLQQAASCLGKAGL